MDMREYMMGLQAEQRPKPQPMQVKATTPVELAQQAARILEGTRQQPAIMGHEPPEIWLGFKTWTVGKAAWLALNIDPHLTAPTWKLCTEREQSLKTLAQEMEHWLIDGSGDKSKASPKDLIHAMRAFGLNHAWMPDDGPIQDDQPSAREEPQIMEILTAALIARYGPEAVADLDADRSETAGNIIRDLQANGCNLTTTTLRKYLKREVIQRYARKLVTTSSRTLPNR